MQQRLIALTCTKRPHEGEVERPLRTDALLIQDNFRRKTLGELKCPLKSGVHVVLVSFKGSSVVKGSILKFLLVHIPCYAIEVKIWRKT